MKETRFKQTEIGLIPEDWEIRKLGSIFKFIPNNTISRDNLVNQGTVMNVHYGDILIKYGSILDIKNNDIPFINDSIISNSKFNEFAKDGDILIADTAEDEMVCKATELYNIENRKLVSGLHTMWIRPIIEFKPKYLGYFFNSTFYHNQILPLIQGTKVCSVSKGAIKDTYISIPLENEQNKIASALTSIDNLLLSLDKLIEKKRLIKQGVMQELLTGKKRLPGFTGEWIERRLGEICKFINGSGFPQPYQGLKQGLYPFYKVSDLNNKGNERKMYKANNYINEKILEKISCNIIPADAIIFAKIGAAIYLERKRITTCKCCIDNNLMAITINDNNSCNYILYYLQSIKLSEIANIATLPNIASKNLAELLLKLPPSKFEQESISSVLSSIDKEIESLEGKKAKYEQVKQGMMQQLLTGKIRLI